MRKIPFWFVFAIGWLPVFAQNKNGATTETPVVSGTIKSATTGMQSMPGFIPMYWDAKKGKVWLEIDKLDTEILYYSSLPAGVGSNDIGLDRGKIGPAHIIVFRRSGSRVLMIELNYDYRAISDNEMEKQAVEESFAQSVHWGFDVTAEENGHVLVDATGFFMQDAVGAVQAISRTKQGNYKLDPQRSVFYLPRTKNFPLNTEIEVTTTLVGESPGEYLREVTPSANAVTFRQHHSFVQLPDNNYTPRIFDPRAGIGSVSFFDYATPVDQPIVKRFVRRHRLQKKDPNAAVSEVVKPIIYYVDPGTPEPIRTALVEGTSWWAQAFEAAGFKNAFQVKLLPPDADPMDIRYNVVQWVHRSTRGWSYGGGITDPRTGEIIKGKVTLGSLRVRQDFLIAQGLVADFEDGKPLQPAIMELCMARMRQLAAHEVGHTLGLPHNYIASATKHGSVMEYPHPLVKIDSHGTLDLSDAYPGTIGDWDKVAITLAYRQFAPGSNEKKEMDQLVKDYLNNGMQFLTDQDARPAGSAHPNTHLWDNGANAADELNRVMKIRSMVLNSFSEKKIPTGSPLATLEEVLVPMYLFHRYQVEATAKVLAGDNYTYALRGDGQVPNTIVPAAEQWKALSALLAAITPSALALPQQVIALIPPRPYGYQPNPRETFKRYTGITFDPLSPAEAAAGMTLGMILHPERAARLVAQHALNADLPSLDKVIDHIVNATFKTVQQSGYAGEIQRTVNNQVIKQLISLSVNKTAPDQVRAIATFKVKELQQWLSTAAGKDIDWKAHYLFAKTQIKGFEEKPDDITPFTPITMPNGAPLGSTDEEWLDE
ncbi:MAG TPA: zinc-dependent metalloprotease [Niastella sp.]